MPDNTPFGKDYIFRTEAAKGLRGRRASIYIDPLHLPGEEAIKFHTVKLIIQQNFSPKWSEEQAYGKMDPIATYSHTGRTMKFNFTVWTDSNDSVELAARNVDKFARFNYPSYIDSGATALKAPPYFEIGVLKGAYMPPVQGYISSLSIAPGHTKGVVMGGGKDENVKRDRAYEIDFTFTIQHQVTPGWVGNTFPAGEKGFMFIANPAGTFDMRDHLPPLPDKPTPLSKDGVPSDTVKAATSNKKDTNSREAPTGTGADTPR